MKRVLNIILLSACLGVELLCARRVPTAAELRAMVADERVKPFFDVIAAAEGTLLDGASGYLRRWPNTYFSGFEKHPEKVLCARLGGRRICATAAGRYMFLFGTWNKVARALGLRDFGPLSQDLAALYLIVTNGALDDVLAERIEEAITKLNRVWATFPGAPYGQPTKSMDYLKRVYEEQRLAYQRGSAGWSPLRREGSHVRGVRYEKTKI